MFSDLDISLDAMLMRQKNQISSKTTLVKTD